MLNCAEALAEFLLSRRASYTQRVLRLRARRLGHARLNHLDADQLVGGLLVSAAHVLRSDDTETLTFYLETGLEGLRSAGEQLDAHVGTMAAFFVGVTDDVAKTFPEEHRDEVVSWIEDFSGACVGGAVRVWSQMAMAA